MKNKQTILGGAILLGLALIYYMTQIGGLDTKTVDSEQYRFDKALVSSIEVNSAEGMVSFVEDNGEWFLEDYPVDTMRMNNFLEHFSSLTVDRLITSKVEKHPKYEVDETSTSILFKSNAGNELLRLMIGKMGAHYQETFVREVESDEVYAVKTSLSRYKSLKPEGFWDKTMTNIDIDKINSVIFQGELNYMLLREGPVWTYNGENVDYEKVSNLLRPFENLKGNNFVDSITEENPFYQSLQITLESGESIDIAFHFKDENENTLLVSVSNKSKVFEYSKAGLTRFDKGLEDLASDPAPEG